MRVGRILFATFVVAAFTVLSQVATIPVGGMPYD